MDIISPDCVFKEICTENSNILYEFGGHLFQRSFQSLTHFGKIIDGKCRLSTVKRDIFKHDYTKIMEKIVLKKVLIYYLNHNTNHIHFHSKLLCETLAANTVVIILGSHLYNICVENVLYMNVDEPQTIKFVNQIKPYVAQIYIEDFSFFAYFSRFEFKVAVCIFMFYYEAQLQCLNNVELSANGLNLRKNLHHCVDRWCFFSADDLRCFKQTIADTAKMNILLSPYIVGNIAFHKLPKIDEESTSSIVKIVSYDTYGKEALQFVSEEKENSYELTLFINETPDGNSIQNLPRNETNFFKSLQSCDVFFTAEIQNYTHFLISMALKCGNVTCIIPKYFQEFASNKDCILFDNVRDLMQKRALVFAAKEKK